MNPSRHKCLLIFLAVLCFSSLPQPAATEAIIRTYTLEFGSVGGSASGGQGGGGFTFSGGEFDVAIDGNSISFLNPNFNPSCDSCAFFPQYPGTITGSSFSGTQDACQGSTQNSFSGEFNGARILFSGVFNADCDSETPTNYAFVATIRAQPIPTMSSAGVLVMLLILGLGGSFLIRFTRT